MSIQPKNNPVLRVEKDMKKLPAWTLCLAAAGLVSSGTIGLAEEAQSSVLTALSQTTLSGYVDTSAIWRPGNDQGPLPGRSFDNADRMDGFNLHAVKLTLERPLDESSFSAGYKADLVFGPDANYYQTLLNGAAGVDADDFAVKQAYVALRAPVGNGLDLKLGVFDTVVGYEVFESGSNPNFSRSYGYFLEPTHHTGLLASYQVNDVIGIAAGVANTFIGPINDRTSSEGAKTFLGAVTISLPEAAGILAGSTIYLGVVDGKNGVNATPNTQDTTSYYAGGVFNTPIEGLALGLAFDYRTDGVKADPLLQTADNWAWATALYASFQATERLKLNLRADFTRGSDGTFYDGGTLLVNDESNELGSLTFTADFSLWENVLTRAEVRWDRSFSGDRIYDNGDSKDAVTVAANLVYKF